ncbi:hypothetical protein ACFVS7_08135 [Streptomyces rubiginosohelvolus]|uniref:hypothetical protein n=1 Tax=Streptomyces rubiginosohelvolus TaxID=67362 RepID=UPI0036DABE6F
MGATSDHRRPGFPTGHSLHATPHDATVGLFLHYETVEEIKAYYGVLAIYALGGAETEAGDEATVRRVKAVVRRFPDEIEHPPYNLPSYRVGGIAQAFLSTLGLLDDHADMLRQYAAEMMTATRDEKGILAMPGRPDLIWIDVAKASAPFLMYAGTALDVPYMDEAATQAVLMHDEFLDPENGLLHQCKGCVSARSGTSASTASPSGASTPTSPRRAAVRAPCARARARLRDHRAPTSAYVRRCGMNRTGSPP